LEGRGADGSAELGGGPGAPLRGDDDGSEDDGDEVGEDVDDDDSAALARPCVGGRVASLKPSRMSAATRLLSLATMKRCANLYTPARSAESEYPLSSWKRRRTYTHSSTNCGRSVEKAELEKQILPFNRSSMTAGETPIREVETRRRWYPDWTCDSRWVTPPRRT
jgi:hypothetical protein